MSLTGIYLGVVEKVGDPEKLGRIKVRVPTVYGIQGDQIGAVTVDNLPWALPMGLPAGGTNASGGLSMLPEVGDQVAVQFLDGEPEKPVWQWLMQTQDQAKTLKLHQYEDVGGTAGSAARAILTRNGHSLEIRPEKVTLTTAEGQQVLLQTSQSAAGGAAALQTPKGQSVTANDLSQSIVIQALDAAIVSGKKVILNAPTSTLVKTERLTLMAGTSMISVQGGTILVTTASGATLVIDEDGNVSLSSADGSALSLETGKVQLSEATGTGSIVLEPGKVSINAPQFVVNSAAFSVGTAMGWPVLLLSPQMLAWLIGHTHTNGDMGSPTGPPIVTDSEFPTDAASLTMRTL
jgi:hypothetical protein